MLKISLRRFAHYCPLPDLLVIARTPLCNFHTYNRQVIHDLWLAYGTYATKGRRMDCSRFMVDIQGTSALWKTVRTPRTDQAQTRNYLSAIGIILLLQPSGKLRKTLISTWRIRILGFQYYGSIT